METFELETKRCTKCGKEYPVTKEYFHINSDARDGLTSRCKLCKNEYSKKWRRKNNIPIRKRHSGQHIFLGKEDVIYFIRGKTIPLIKIGYTNCIQRRYMELQNSSSDMLEIIKTLPGNRKQERDIHHKFRYCCHHGEWYNPTPELMGYINTI